MASVVLSSGGSLQEENMAGPSVPDHVIWISSFDGREP